MDIGDVCSWGRTGSDGQKVNPTRLMRSGPRTRWWAPRVRALPCRPIGAVPPSRAYKGRCMRRRHLIGRIAVWSTVASAVLAQTAHSQQSLPVIGFLNAGAAKAYERPLAAFLQGLSESGFDDGRNVRIEYRWAGVSKERLTVMAADLVQPKVTLIAATTAPAALAAKAATPTVPIVFETGEDPVALGLVTNLI